MTHTTVLLLTEMKSYTTIRPSWLRSTSKQNLICIGFPNFIKIHTKRVYSKIFILLHEGDVKLLLAKKDGQECSCNTTYSLSGIYHNQRFTTKPKIMQLFVNTFSPNFWTLYITLPHDKLKSRWEGLIRKYSIVSKKLYCVLVANHIFFFQKGKVYHTEKQVCMVDFLIDSIFVTFEEAIFKHQIGIRLGTNYATLIGNLF